MSYGEESTASDGIEPDEDELDSEDYDEAGSEDDADWDDEAADN
jgi:hypothetical protein